MTVNRLASHPSLLVYEMTDCSISQHSVLTGLIFTHIMREAKAWNVQTNKSKYIWMCKHAGSTKVAAFWRQDIRK